MDLSVERDQRVLVVRGAARACAIPLDHVAETMRPLPVDTVTGAPAYVAGLAVVRGVPTPVVELARLIGEPSAPATRFVSMRAGGRPVVLAVGEIVGVRTLQRSTPRPPLFGAGDTVLAALATLDAELLLVLRGIIDLPDFSSEAR